MLLSGTHVVVTGASRGIGEAIALKCAASGADVTVVGRHPESLAAVKASVEALGVRCAALPADVTDVESVRAMVRGAEDEIGPVDALVNNVGWDRTERFWDNTPEFWDTVIDVNYKSVLYCSRAVLDGMMQRRSGKIVNIASDAGRVGSSGESAYAGAKGAVISFTKSLAREVARFQISVNCVCPGPTNTPLYREQPEKIRAALEHAIPMRRVAEPDEVAGAAVFFSSPLAGYVTGQVLSVSGGLTMQG